MGVSLASLFLLMPFSCVVHAADVDQDYDEAINSLPTLTVQGARGRVPSEALLDRGSPQSIVNAKMIQEVASSVGDYGTVANLTPSFDHLSTPRFKYRSRTG